MAKKAAELVTKCLNGFEADEKSHRDFARKADERYRAYRGILERRSEAAAWTNKQHPAYVWQSIETVVGSLVDPAPKWRLRARPVMGDPKEVERLRAGAEANELLLSHQLSLDHFAEKQRPYDLQALITGLSVSKQYWKYGEGIVRSLESFEEPIVDGYGQLSGTIPRLREAEQEHVLKDDPTCEVIDVRDFIWHEGAISLEKAQRVTHRCWYSFDELKQMEKQGLYSNVDKLKESKDQDHKAGLYDREQDLFQTNRSKDQIEVLECWIEGGNRVVSIGNRTVLLRDEPNPFWFDKLDHPYPFVVVSAAPDLFRIPGISDVEMMQELQETLWTLANQRLDALQLSANAIFMIADDVEDPDAFEIGPGEKWLVPRPVDETIKPWTPDTNIPQLTLQAEALLKGDLQNITGGMPFLSGTDTAGMDNQTATGVSILSTLAQRRLAAKKQQFTWAKRRIGEQWCALNQQFIRAPRLVPIVGYDGAEAFKEIQPDLIQGHFVFETEMVEESLMRQERRAEAQAKLQVAINAQQYFIASPGQPQLNLKAYMDDYLDAYDIDDKQRYYSESPPPQAAQLMQGSPQGAPSQNGSDGGGVTNPQLAAGVTSPSNETSMAPGAALQRMQAMVGGPNNQ